MSMILSQNPTCSRIGLARKPCSVFWMPATEDPGNRWSSVERSQPWAVPVLERSRPERGGKMRVVQLELCRPAKQSAKKAEKNTSSRHREVGRSYTPLDPKP